ncbi:MAG: tRNA preQ1(34) S-adenosylmethionine ribosyltransferase-isomerase QueA [Phycisphaerales bacterium]|nr:tRNA preQ1(34) S-adenosylmethionine ribosyltransferase-isomerase QueA [Phycisphaerales bacterium]
MTTTLTIEDLMYELPEGMIATAPANPRSSAKMLVIDGENYLHKRVAELPNFIERGSVLVVNETSVMPARFFAKRIDSGGKVEGLFLQQDDSCWNVMLKSNGKLREGIVIEIIDGVQLKLLRKVEKNWLCECSDSRSALDILTDNGSTPIPPYIIGARGDLQTDDYIDRINYQTVYADLQQCRSVAAPTAGLHFDAELLDAIQADGIQVVSVTLDVGAGTFKGIETSRIEDHEMHEERWFVSQNSLDVIRKTVSDNRKIIAVGTTSVRTLESLPDIGSWPESGGLSGNTKLMITPPYRFQLVDGILTNFHLPKSTLLALVAAKIGIDKMKSAYAEAISSGYRFYSYGDAMFIPPDLVK